MDTELSPLHNLSPFALRVTQWLQTLLDAQQRPQATADLFVPHLDFYRFYRHTSGLQALLADWHERDEAFAEPLLSFEIIFDTPRLVVANYVLRGHLVGRCGSILPTGASVWTMGMSFFHTSLADRADAATRPIVECLRDEWDTSDILYQLGSVIPTDNYHKKAHRAGAMRELKVPVRAHLTIWARHFALSPRLAQVGSLLLSGANTTLIAKTLGLSITSLRSYIRDLYAATGVHSQSDFAQCIAKVSGLNENG